MWRTSSRVAYRNFLGDFKQGDIYKNAESGCWERDKSLVYDGQQRLLALGDLVAFIFQIILKEIMVKAGGNWIKSPISARYST